MEDSQAENGIFRFVLQHITSLDSNGNDVLLYTMQSCFNRCGLCIVFYYFILIMD